MVFSSKKDIWMGIVIWILIGAFSWLFYQTAFIQKNAFGSMLLLALVTLLAAVWFSTHYIIEDDVLHITYGPLKKAIHINEIRSIRYTTNPFVAPSLSAQRIEVNYGKFQTVQISPKDKDVFVNELKEKNPNIQLDI